jgi:hypothetical protein
MPVDPQAAAMAMARGLSAVCVTCDKYWGARERGVPEDRCLSVDGCGSPIAGDDFHEYKGPITDFLRYCFVCGRAAAKGVRAQGRFRICGICEQHLPLLHTLQPKNKPEPVRDPVVMNGKETDLAGRLFRPKKPGLFQAIMETEQYFAEQAARGKRG